ncbi:30S ribosomal protein S2 [Flavobacteriaceae bacterium]|nr:30S ribosomal protein S2 [Flavobacteriaceae bacterium]
MTENKKTINSQAELNNPFSFTIKNLLEAGVHFGHKSSRRNCKMSKYIHSNRNGLSIIDLNKSAHGLYESLKIVKEVVKNNGKILFVGTKKQAKSTIKESAERCGQFYVSEKWPGGLLTNWRTSVKSIRKLSEIEREIADNEHSGKLNKKELLLLDRTRQKLDRVFGGIRKMGGYPDLVFFVDVRKENIAIQECKKLNIPRMSILDTNCDPDNSTYIIPGNDDSVKAIRLYCRLISDAALLGIKEQSVSAGSSNESVNKIAKKVDSSRVKKAPVKKATVKKDEAKKSDVKKSTVKSDAPKKNMAKKDETKKKPIVKK